MSSGGYSLVNVKVSGFQAELLGTMDIRPQKAVKALLNGKTRAFLIRIEFRGQSISRVVDGFS
jgi:hypothetical protein